jgi:hypothetical protein
MSPHLRFFAAILPSVLAAAGCGVILGIDDFTDGPGTTSQGGGGSGGTTTTEGGGGAGGTTTTTEGGGGAGGTTTTQGGGGAGGTTTTTTTTGTCEPGEKQPCYEGPAGTENVGICKAGEQTCVDGTSWSLCKGQVLPEATENCLTKALDEDCDGLEDQMNDCCTPNEPVSCYSGPPGTVGVGQCKAGSVPCNADGTVPTVCIGDVVPADEFCSGQEDEDCNGRNCWVWSQAKGAFSEEYGSAVATDPFFKRVVVGGNFDGAINLGGGLVQPFQDGKDDGFLAAYDMTGAHLWSKRIGKDAQESILDLTWDGNGLIGMAGYYLFGDTDLGGGSLGAAAGIDAFVGLFDADGQNLWSRKVSGPGTEFVQSIRRTTNGLVIAGSFDSSVMVVSGGAAGDSTLANSSAGGGSNDVFVAQYSNAGALMWVTKIGGSAADSTTGTSDTMDADFVSGAAYVAGKTTGSLTIGSTTLPNSTDIFLAKIAGDGAILWGKGYDVQGQLFSVAAGPQGPYLAGTLTGTSVLGSPVTPVGGNDIVIAAHDGNGTVLWTKVFGGSGDDALSSIKADSNGITIAGTYSQAFNFDGFTLPAASPPAGGNFIARLTPQGNVVWVHAMGAVVSDLAIDGAGYTLFTGGFYGTANFGGGAVNATGASVDIFFGKLGK